MGNFYKQLKSEIAKLTAVKEQIWHLLDIWDWLEDRNPFTSLVFMNYLLKVVITLADKLEVPRETSKSLNVSDLPQVKNIGIVLESSEELKGLSDTKLAELKQVGREKKRKM